MELPLRLLNINTKHLNYTDIKAPPLITVKILEIYFFNTSNVN